MYGFICLNRKIWPGILLFYLSVNRKDLLDFWPLASGLPSWVISATRIGLPVLSLSPGIPGGMLCTTILVGKGFGSREPTFLGSKKDLKITLILTI